MPHAFVNEMVRKMQRAEIVEVECQGNKALPEDLLTFTLKMPNGKKIKTSTSIQRPPDERAGVTGNKYIQELFGRMPNIKKRDSVKFVIYSLA